MIGNWTIIKGILDNHAVLSYQNKQQTLAGPPMDAIQEALEQELDFDQDYYQISVDENLQNYESGIVVDDEEEESKSPLKVSEVVNVLRATHSRSSSPGVMHKRLDSAISMNNTSELLSPLVTNF